MSRSVLVVCEAVSSHAARSETSCPPRWPRTSSCTRERTRAPRSSHQSRARWACCRSSRLREGLALEEQDTLFITIFASPSAMDLQLEHMQVMDLQLEHMHVLHSSVYAWRRCENKVRTDPTLLGGRRRLIVCWGTAAVGGLDVLYHQAPKVAAREPARAACAQNAGAHPPGGGMMVIVQSTQVLDCPP